MKTRLIAIVLLAVAATDTMFARGKADPPAVKHFTNSVGMKFVRIDAGITLTPASRENIGSQRLRARSASAIAAS